MIKLETKTWGLICGVIILLVIGFMIGRARFVKHNVGINYFVSPIGQNPQEKLGETSQSELHREVSDVLSNFQCENLGSVIASRSGMVKWQKPELLNGLSLFESVVKPGDPSGFSDFGTDQSYLVGRFTAGPYVGGDVLLTFITYNAPGRPVLYRIVKQGNTYTVLNKYSEALPDTNYVKAKVNLKQDVDFLIADLEFPDKLQSDNPKLNLQSAPAVAFYKNGGEFFCQDGLAKVFTDSVVGDVFTNPTASDTGMFPRFGFYVKAGDSTVRYYKMDIEFMGPDKVPLITWQNGKVNTKEYDSARVGGCGAGEFLAVRDVQIGDLTPIGQTTVNNQPIYFYKNSQTQELRDLYDGMYVPEGKTKMTYTAFLSSYPIFFWQDVLGRFIEFKSSDYQPLAECGKPVIYLYPTQTQHISVQVEPQGGMSKSIPDYNQGWNVIADPQSQIINLADGKNYPYLFWEGRGGIYKTPEKGFVVAKSDVAKFLNDKLNQLGLNGKEIGDFMEFWYPQMQASPYYFVTFLGNAAMNELAPLTITPKPDTLIRVLMDFMPLEKPIHVTGYNIHTPERKGFTVVEWGGVFR